MCTSRRIVDVLAGCQCEVQAIIFSGHHDIQGREEWAPLSRFFSNSIKTVFALLKPNVIGIIGN